MYVCSYGNECVDTVYMQICSAMLMSFAFNTAL